MWYYMCKKICILGWEKTHTLLGEKTTQGVWALLTDENEIDSFKRGNKSLYKN